MLANPRSSRSALRPLEGCAATTVPPETGFRSSNEASDLTAGPAATAAFAVSGVPQA